MPDDQSRVMDKPRCRSCGNEKSFRYRDYYNPSKALLWEATYCAKCSGLCCVAEILPRFDNFAVRHRWYLPVLRVGIIVLVGSLVGCVLQVQMARWLRITFIVLAALSPGIYGLLHGTDGERTSATSQEELSRLLAEK